MQALKLLSSISSPHTKLEYNGYFKKHQEFVGINEDIFCGNNPRLIEHKIIDFITDMKARSKGYSAIHNYAAAIFAFYKINDVVLNISKINKFIPLQSRVRRDRAYTHEEISKILEFADESIRVVILLMVSAGIRRGALPYLRLRDLDDNNRKLTVYENEKEEYFTFITPECKKTVDSANELLEYERPLVAINPKFDKLITSLRTAISDDLGKLSKEDTSYDNVLDAFRLALKGIKVVKKENEIG